MAIPVILFKRPDPIDWFLLLNDFKKLGHKIPEVARALGCPERTAYSWAEGSTPLYEDGRALVLLYRTTFDKEPPFKPYVPAPAFEAANGYS